VVGASVAATIALGMAGSARGGDPGLTLAIAPTGTLVDGVYVEVEATATCDPSYAGTFYAGGMYLTVFQDTQTGQASGEGDAGEPTSPGLICDGQPHTYTTSVYPDYFNATAFKAGPAQLLGTLVLYGTDGSISYDQVQVRITIHGAPPAPAPPNSLGFTWGPAVAYPDGSVSLTLQGSCGAEYAGDYLSGSASVNERTAAGVARGYLADYVTLQCDGQPHQYRLTPEFANDPAVPFKPGLAVVDFSELTVSTPDGNIVDDTYQGGWGMHIVG
jgi:hypothetical protein